MSLKDKERDPELFRVSFFAYLPTGAACFSECRVFRFALCGSHNVFAVTYPDSCTGT